MNGSSTCARASVPVLAVMLGAGQVNPGSTTANLGNKYGLRRLT
jgi:hypothetical protein